MPIDVESFRSRRNDDRWNRTSVGDIIERVTWSEPDKVALITTADCVVNPAHQRVTYRQANTLINRVANALLALNLEPAARVAMLCDNSTEAWLSKIGIAKAGFRTQGRWVDPEILRLQLPYALHAMVLPQHALALLAFDKHADAYHHEDKVKKGLALS